MFRTLLCCRCVLAFDSSAVSSLALKAASDTNRRSMGTGRRLPERVDALRAAKLTSLTVGHAEWQVTVALHGRRIAVPLHSAPWLVAMKSLRRASVVSMFLVPWSSPPEPDPTPRDKIGKPHVSDPVSQTDW